MAIVARTMFVLFGFGLPLAAFTVLATLPIALTGDTMLPYNGGDVAQFAWHLAWNWHALTTDPLGFADTNVLYPLTNTAFLHHLLLPPAIPFGLVYGLTHNPILSANAVLLLSIWLNAMGGALLALRFTRGDRLAAFAGAVATGFSPILMGRLFHIPLIMIWWMPLAILCVDAYLWRPRLRYGVAAVVLIWLQFITAHYLNFYIVIACGLYVVAVALSLWWDRRLGPVLAEVKARRRTLAVHGLALAVLAAALLVPPVTGYLRVAEAWGAQRNIGEVISFSASPMSFLNVDPDSLPYGRNPLRRFTAQLEWDHEKHPFPGLLPVALAVVAWLAVRREPADYQRRARVRAAIVICVVAVVLALGPYLVLFGRATPIPLPYLPLYHLVPGFTGMRVPARFPIMAVPALAILVAFGISALRGRGRRRYLPAATVGLLVLELSRGPVPTGVLVDVFSKADLALVDRGQGPLIWLPIALPEPDINYLETARMVQNQSLRPMVNGYQAFIPPIYHEFKRMTAIEPPEVIAAALNRIGVESVLLDTKRVDPAVVRGWDRLAATPGPDGVASVQPGERLRAFELQAVPAADAEPSVRIAGRRISRLRKPSFWLDFHNRSEHVWVSSYVQRKYELEVRWRRTDSADELLTKGRVLVPLYVAPSGTTSTPVEIALPEVDGEYAVEARIVGTPFELRDSVQVLSETLPNSHSHAETLRGTIALSTMPSGWVTVGPGDLIWLRGVLENTGGSQWLSVVPIGGPVGQVRVGAQWFPHDEPTPNREMTQLQGRIDIFRDVLPGESAPFVGGIKAPSAPGRYLLRVGILAEGRTWLHEIDPLGDRRIAISVLVNPA